MTELRGAVQLAVAGAVLCAIAGLFAVIYALLARASSKDKQDDGKRRRVVAAGRMTGIVALTGLVVWLYTGHRYLEWARQGPGKPMGPRPLVRATEEAGDAASAGR